jgi:hypothetical protein
LGAGNGRLVWQDKLEGTGKMGISYSLLKTLTLTCTNMAVPRSLDLFMFMGQSLTRKAQTRRKNAKFLFFCNIRPFRSICVKDFLTLE